MAFWVVRDKRITRVLTGTAVEAESARTLTPSAPGGGGTQISGSIEAVADWTDENDTYTLLGLNTSGALLDILDDNRWSQSQLDTFQNKQSIGTTSGTQAELHGTSEGDELWTAYHMYRRLNGIRQAAADYWYVKAAGFAVWFKTGFVDSFGWDYDRDAYEFCHTYGQGLVDWAIGEQDADAVTAIDTIIARISAYSAAVTPGDSLLTYATGSRRWARFLLVSVRAADVSPTAANIAWRDKVIDCVLQMPEWDATYNAYWIGQYDTDQKLGAGAYASNQRIQITFHMGVMMHGLWRAWMSTGRADVRQRLVDLATFYRDHPLDGEGFFQIYLGRDLDDGSTITAGGSAGDPGDPHHGSYTTGPIIGLVAAYKLTGDSTYLARARQVWQTFQEYHSGTPGELHHFTDTQIASGDGFQYLLQNKGELQYAHLLFENGGQPTVLTTQPSWYTAANEKTWAALGDNTFMSVDPEQNSAWTWRSNPGWVMQYGPLLSDHQVAVVENWNSAVARDDYLAIGFAGGHYGSVQNTVYEFGPFTAENPQWWWHGNADDGAGGSKYDPPSHTGTATAGETPISSWASEEAKGYYSDGKATSRHTYDNICFVPQGAGEGFMFAPLAVSVFASQGGTNRRDAASFRFPFAADVGGYYEAQGTHPNWPGSTMSEGGGCEYDSGQGLVWVMQTQGPAYLYSYDPVTHTYTQRNQGNPNGGTWDTDGFTIDPVRRLALCHNVDSQNGNRLIVWDIDIADEIGTATGKVGQHVTIVGNYSGALTGAGNIGFEYEPVGGKLVGYNGGATLYELQVPADYRNADGTLNPNASWTWAAISNGAGGATPTGAGKNGTYGRFRYIPSIKAFAVFNDPTDASVYVYKIPAGGL